jgi:hypothetical protein
MVGEIYSFEEKASKKYSKNGGISATFPRILRLWLVERMEKQPASRRDG